ncbi:MAG: PBP1A family penicillin-binding protein [Deltaproteobacteria bacterium]|nr:PBP1A family penicillin-binding protein [Deltaproteobacteria bacterium]
MKPTTGASGRPPRRVRVANRARRGPAWRFVLAAVAWLFLAVPQVAVITLARGYQQLTSDLPQVPDLPGHERLAPRSSQIMAADGTVLAELPFVVGKEAGHRLWAPYESFPPTLVHALLAAEDVRFFSHRGIDVRAVARAAIANYRNQRISEGASTITQQVARNLLPEEIGRERTVRRKLREALLARRIERQYSKERILETYANHVFLGAGAYGVAAAARAYFSKTLADLTVGEHALIAGLAQAPGRADPYLNLAAARARRDDVLSRMRRAGFLDEETFTAALGEPITLLPPPNLYGARAPWLTERARKEAGDLDSAALARGGLVVETTALPAADESAGLAARAATTRIAKRQGTSPPQVGAIVFDHVTGYVEVLVGGTDFHDSQFDRAMQACRQPGSAFKPIVYAAAIEQNAITPGSLLRDAPITEYDDALGIFWKPTSSGHGFRGAVLAQEALALSLNPPAVDVIDRIGPQAAVSIARRLGISTALAPVRPLVLGSSCVHPWQLARAYAVFASGGKRVDPVVVTRVIDRTRVVVDRASPLDPFLDPRRRLERLVASLTEAGPPGVLDPQSAFLMSSMLAEVVSAGTGRSARLLGRPVAGKTGTTNGNTDAWFVGYTGRVTAATWIGHDDPAIPLGPREDASHAALPLWVDLVRQVEGERPGMLVPGTPPGGVVGSRINRESGLPANPGIPGTWVYFRKGTEPPGSSNHQEPGQDVGTESQAEDLSRSLEQSAREF